MDYLQVGIGENMVVGFKGYTVVVVPYVDLLVALEAVGSVG